jgi:hypothetical protein
VREQVAIAAMDLGQLDQAQVSRLGFSKAKALLIFTAVHLLATSIHPLEEVLGFSSDSDSERTQTGSRG